MPNARRLVFAGMLALAVACGGDDDNGPSSSDFTGTWDATKFEFVNVANTADRIEVIGLGGSLTVVLNSNGTCTLTIQIPGEPPEVENCTWSAGVDVFTLRPSSMSGQFQFDYTLSGNTLTLTGADAEFDFNDDGIDDAAKLNITLVR